MQYDLDMNSNEKLLADTLYVTMKVIDRSLEENPDHYASIKDEIEDLQKQLRRVLDLVDMIETPYDKENLMAG